MPSRNLFILAAAMQLPLALWLHGCKDDKDDDDSNNQDNQSNNTDNASPANGEQQPAESKMHSKFFLEGQYKELIKDLVAQAQKGKDVEFKVRKGIWDQNTEKTTATALASYINESTEGMVALHGSAFTYEQLRKDWRAEYVVDIYESEMQLQVAPGTVSTPALQWYMNGKTNQVMFSDFRYNNGAYTAQTKVVDAHGVFEQVNQNMNQQMVAPKRNLIVTELYHGGYDTIATPPKNNPRNLAVTFFQVSQDMDVFWEICVRAFHQVISINQMFAMTVSNDDVKNWSKVSNKDTRTFLTAWEVIEEKETNKWTLNTQLGSRKPDVGKLSQRHQDYILSLQKELKKYRDEVWDQVYEFFVESWVQQPNEHYDLTKPEDFKKMMDIAIMENPLAQWVPIFEFTNAADCTPFNIDPKQGFPSKPYPADPSAPQSGEMEGTLKLIGYDNVGPKSKIVESLENMQAIADKLWETTEKVEMIPVPVMLYCASDDAVHSNIEAVVMAPEFTKYKYEDGYNVIDEFPKFLFDLLIANKPVAPEKAGLNAFENFRRELRRDQKHDYVIPNRKELLALETYKIEVLEVIHPGSAVEIEFAETMMAAFYHTYRSVKKATYLQHPSNHQVILGDASAIVGHNGYNPYQQPNPIVRALDFKNDMMIKVLRFVTIESMTEGEAAVECFEKIADRLNTVEVKVTIKEHKEVAKLKPGKKNTIGEHIRTMQ